MKKICGPDIIQLLAIAMLLITFGCKKTEDIKTSRAKPEVELFDKDIDSTGNRFAPRKIVHLSKDTVYVLNQDFTREAGEQLIIDAGVLVKVTAPPPNTAAGPSITIKPGGIITAAGTSTEPIVFTSNAPAGTQGNNWDGIVIMGKSYNNSNGPDGIATDFSGVIQYVRVEFASITLVGVGNETVFENVMVSYTNKAIFALYHSAFNFYGGTFNARNLVSYACSGPTDFFITNGYNGNMQNIIASRHPFFGQAQGKPYNTLAGVYIQNNDNNNPAPVPYTNPVISNLTVVGPNGLNGSPAAYSDTNILAASLVTTNSACFHIRNSIMLAYPAACWILNDHATAFNLEHGNGEFNFSIAQSNNEPRCFYLAPGAYDPYSSEQFKRFILTFFSNQEFLTSDQFKLSNITNYDSGPDLMPMAGSPILSGGSYDSSALYNNAYFDKTETFKGALGQFNWLMHWTNFIPLKTNYNFPQ